MYLFPVAAIKNDDKLNGLKLKMYFIYSSTVQSKMGLHTAFLSGDSRGEPISLLFLASRGHLYSLDFAAYLPLSKPAV